MLDLLPIVALLISKQQDVAAQISVYLTDIKG